ncbi:MULTISPECIES: pyridoxamine 5'-phosphate oxidase family protein [unclassified Gordonia (in: high G+C Gram-positive bacteria)]|uniref:pyridoxamine 5'-phosphate oxidase family protein n=1 Tax=unclassified Gordonia (in: high G+C Gram-positive bacteria) TaxID=2657482 RepID=UPI001FFF199D|nr:MULTISPECIES: pyridoxamine 5'-phosphate oxidase family protein [unclassified Gordonia (in: high G+C Gram-positive bacteria)]UQE74610.1 pyridoxamine 5'-phosphate oxidase family protein [Gordonia sp. PP30]
MVTEPDILGSLKRKRDRRGDRELLDEILDSTWVGTLSTVVDGFPWSVPMIFARVGDDVLVHGSTGAGALRHVAAGAPVTLTVTLVDGLVVADTLMDHSANYRSAVLRGHLTACDDPAAALIALTDAILPGRSAELPPPTAKDLAATAILRLPIVDDHWIAKARRGGPSSDSAEWTGVVDVVSGFGQARRYTGGETPASVRRIASGPVDPDAGPLAFFRDAGAT